MAQNKPKTMLPRDIKRALFAQAIVEGKSQTEAALLVGIGKTSASAQGSRMIRDDSIRRLIEELRARQEPKRWGKDQVLGTLEALAIAGSATYRDTTKGGAKHTAIEDGSTAVKACDLIGKHLGLWDQAAQGPEISINLYFPELVDASQATEIYGGTVIDIAPSEAPRQITGPDTEAD
jgi:hypothetical protein